MSSRLKRGALIVATAAVAASHASAERQVRRVAPDETWQMREGRFYRNDEWVFIRSAKFLDGLAQPEAAGKMIAAIDILVERYSFNSFSLNIYPSDFDLDADGKVDASHQEGYAGIARVIDHCWERGVFCALGFETGNAGGGGVPPALFDKHPDIVAVNALGEPASDVEYLGDFEGRMKPLPSMFHPAYLKWSRDFIRSFLRGLGSERSSRLLYVETTVEPQYLGHDNSGKDASRRDDRRAALDFCEAARADFRKWNVSLSEDDDRRDAVRWPASQEERDRAVGDLVFNEWRGQALGEWVTGDIRAIHSVAPQVYIAVDYNGRFDDALNLRIGDHEAFLAAIEGADIIQIAPHQIWPWGTSSWNDVIRMNRRAAKGWAVSEHMSITGGSPENDKAMTDMLENTLHRGTRWGWDAVKVANTRDSGDGFALCNGDWSSPVLDVFEGTNWDAWCRKIGVKRFVPQPRTPIGKVKRPG